MENLTTWACPACPPPARSGEAFSGAEGGPFGRQRFADSLPILLTFETSWHSRWRARRGGRGSDRANSGLEFTPFEFAGCTYRDKCEDGCWGKLGCFALPAG